MANGFPKWLYQSTPISNVEEIFLIHISALGFFHTWWFLQSEWYIKWFVVLICFSQILKRLNSSLYVNWPSVPCVKPVCVLSLFVVLSCSYWFVWVFVCPCCYIYSDRLPNLPLCISCFYFFKDIFWWQKLLIFPFIASNVCGFKKKCFLSPRSESHLPLFSLRSHRALLFTLKFLVQLEVIVSGMW